MKKLCLTTMIASLLLFILVGCTSKQSDQLTLQQTEQIKSEFKSIYDNFSAKWTGLDAQGIVPYYSPELVVVFDTLLLNYETYLKGWSDYTKTTETIKLDPIYRDIRILTKDLVIATWCGNVERLMKSGDLITAKPGIWTDVWKRVDGQWKAIYEHGSGSYITQAAEKK
jgi:ketosteroid isomerase-like protein